MINGTVKIMRDYIIESENSTDHWPFFKTSGHNVLDLGCGRWYTDKKEELSPFYFGRDANLVVGVDYNAQDIEYYTQETEGDPKYVFKAMNLINAEQFKELINTYNITALKCDIEGDEVHMLKLTKQDLINISEIAIEYHSEDLRDKFIAKLEEWGFSINTFANFARTPISLGVLFCSK